MDAGILIVDDEKNITELAKLYLAREGFKVETAYNGKEALEKVKSRRPDLIVLDLMMPEMDGWEFCRSLRKVSDIPVIILSARDEEVDKIAGLELGADDYITKPFNPRELVARVRAVLRRYNGAQQPQKVLNVGDLRIDLAGRSVYVRGKPVELRAKEFDLLSALAKSSGEVLEREKLLETVWGYNFYGDTRTIDVHVASLREKIAGSSAEIQTVRSVGYKLIVAG
ncbi:MAG: response regulator transcription factor [Chloroflexi bacterium]|nr:response regulator transcription factor [Chloroflexota bacterium]